MNINQDQAAEVFDDFLFAMDDQIEWLIEEAKKTQNRFNKLSQHTRASRKNI